MVSEDAMTQEK